MPKTPATKPEKLEAQSADLPKLNREKLKELFPNVVFEDHIDYEALKLLVDEQAGEGEKAKERYAFTWPGKSEAIRVAQEPAQGTLVPDKDASVDFDNTQNLYLEGDNLEILKLLQKSYAGKVKMIYIDPPYNTGKDFIYPDKYSEGLQTYLEYTGQVDGQGKKFSTNTETDGRYHSKWLNMMYPRLMLARNLLREDGVIFVSIDDHEVHNLKKLMDEVFDASNFLAQLPVITNLKGNQDEFGFAGTHEYGVVYARQKNSCNIGLFDVDEEESLDEWEIDDIGYYKKGANLKGTGVNAPRSRRPNLFFPLYVTQDNRVLLARETDSDVEILPITDSAEMSWRWSKGKFAREGKNVIVVRDGATVSLYKKQRPSLGDLPTKKPKSIFYRPEYSSGNGTGQIKELFNKKVFNNPKPVDLISDFIKIGSSEGDTVLDFYSGSGTTAHAVLKLNAEEKTTRRFILTQLQEPISLDEQNQREAAEFCTAHGLELNISEIGKERIRRAGSKVLEDNTAEEGFDPEKFDKGFKVFHLTSSNFTPWDSSPEGDVQMRLMESTSSLKPEAKADDILYEILLRSGFSLAEKVEKRSVNGIDTYSVAGGALLVCLGDGLTLEYIREIAKEKPARFVALERGFEKDDLLTNAAQHLKQHEVEFRVL